MSPVVPACAMLLPSYSLGKTRLGRISNRKHLFYPVCHVYFSRNNPTGALNFLAISFQVNFISNSE